MNKVILMGRLTRDPEVRYTTTNNTLVASFSLAVNRRFARQGEERQADFINIVAWEKSAEFCGKYLTKGTRILVEGRLQTRTYDAQDGSKRYITEVVSENIEFAGAKRAEDDSTSKTEYTRPSTSPSQKNYNDFEEDDFVGDEISDDKVPF